ncbi:hypothetical protein FCV25MIE_28782 [Fagus crenata]
MKRLDRAVANVKWMDMFNLCTVSHVVCSYSDHVPLLLHMDAGSGARILKRRPRKFEEKWALHPECEKIIKEVWTEAVSRGSPMFDLCERIKKCRERLHAWFRKVSSEFQSKIKVFTSTLTHLITSNTSGQNTEDLDRDYKALRLHQPIHP